MQAINQVITQEDSNGEGDRKLISIVDKFHLQLSTWH